jgi:DedD protein
MPKGDDGQYELILETRQVLVIFLFAVVLCGVFFGLGFVVGRHSTGGAGGAEVAAIPTTDHSSGKQHPLSPAEKPVEPAAEQTPPADTPPAADSDPKPAPETKAPEPKPVEKPVEKPPVEKPHVEPEKPKPAPTEVVPNLVPRRTDSQAPAVPGPIVLQVSAHGKREDAEPVVALLKRKNFPASIVTVPTDTLFHVQVGPYASVPEAEAAKKSLEEQGFKPYLKK